MPTTSARSRYIVDKAISGCFFLYICRLSYFLLSLLRIIRLYFDCKNNRNISIMEENSRDFSFVKEKILQFIDFKGISKYKFYQDTGIANGILSQKGGISEENMLKILSYFPEINANWLLTGEGDMIKTNHNYIGDNSISKSNVQQGNHINDISAIIKVQESFQRMIEKRDEQIDRLIAIIERKHPQ